jgi:ABC-type multidrug transport system fused ATPase/permease subunit
MAAGQVVEQGSHAELSARRGLYARLHQSGFAEDQKLEPVQ